MKGFGIKLILLAIIFAILAALAGYTVLNQAAEDIQNGPVETVLVAAVTIPESTRITADMVQKQERPVEAVDTFSLTDPAEIVGKFASADILQGESFRIERLIEEEKARVVYRMKKGYRTVTVGVDPYAAAADMIVPGDRVDIAVYLPEKKDNGVLIHPDVASLFLANIEVVAVDREIETGKSAHEEVPERYAVTVAIPVQYTEQLVLAEHIGFVELMLRPVGDHSTPTTTNAIWQDLIQ